MTGLKKKSRRLKAVLCCLLPALFCSCQSLKRAAAPLWVCGGRICKRDCLGLEFSAVNLCGRPVEGAVFFARIVEGSDDGDFEGSFEGAFYEKSFFFEGPFDCGGEERLFIPFEEADQSLEAEDFEIESLVLESASFEDGECWTRNY